MSKPKYTFTHECPNDGIETHYPDDLKIEVSFTHDGHITTLIQGFKDFLKGCGWGEKTINQYMPEE